MYVFLWYDAGSQMSFLHAGTAGRRQTSSRCRGGLHRLLCRGIAGRRSLGFLGSDHSQCSTLVCTHLHMAHVPMLLSETNHCMTTIAYYPHCRLARTQAGLGLVGLWIGNALALFVAAAASLGYMLFKMDWEKVGTRACNREWAGRRIVRSDLDLQGTLAGTEIAICMRVTH